jgi:hypothetical protein
MVGSGRLNVRLVWIVFGGWLFAAHGGAQTKPTAKPTKAPAPAVAPEPGAEQPPQTLLMPGLYLFQTRTRDGSCNDAPRTGYVTSSVATLDGVPGSRSMTMQLLNSKYWPTWTLTITDQDTIVGTANMSGAKDDSNGSSRFEMKIKKDRFQGVGARSYPGQADGKNVRCTLNYDVLLKVLD